MHEFSVMGQMVETILHEAKNRDAIEVKEVILEIGEFTFLGREQLLFAFDVFKEEDMLKNARLIIEVKKAAIECDCGYKGGIEYSNTPLYHQRFPIVSCPKCNAVPNIVAGKDCIIRNITMEI